MLFAQPSMNFGAALALSHFLCASTAFTLVVDGSWVRAFFLLLEHGAMAITAASFKAPRYSCFVKRARLHFTFLLVHPCGASSSTSLLSASALTMRSLAILLLHATTSSSRAPPSPPPSPARIVAALFRPSATRALRSSATALSISFPTKQPHHISASAFPSQPPRARFASYTCMSGAAPPHAASALPPRSRRISVLAFSSAPRKHALRSPITAHTHTRTHTHTPTRLPPLLRLPRTPTASSPSHQR
mmetsp:Transcript_2490/g.6746  ORF Transcript_2490/g.6746 Transcript_2490/m.6746 type:complete len:247 (-) Transcript_2490:45-785(-)